MTVKYKDWIKANKPNQKILLYLLRRPTTHLINHLVYWKIKVVAHLPKNLKPLLKPTKSHHPRVIILQLCLLQIIQGQPKAFCPLTFHTHYKEGRKSKEYSKKTKWYSRAFTTLPNNLSLMCAKLVKNNLVSRTKRPKPRISIPRGCYYQAAQMLIVNTTWIRT